MKTTFLCTHTLIAGLMLAGMFAAVPAAAQERPDCTSCECNGSIFSYGCEKSCCKPYEPQCNCSVWFSTCSCLTASIPPKINEQNIRDFGAFLRTAAFPSPAAMNLANDILLYLQAYSSGSIETFYTVAERLETTTRQLTTTEKQHANQWIVARGGRPNTIP